MNNVTHQKCEINEHKTTVHGEGTTGCDECDNVIPGGYHTKNTKTDHDVLFYGKDPESYVIDRYDSKGDGMVERLYNR